MQVPSRDLWARTSPSEAALHVARWDVHALPWDTAQGASIWGPGIPWETTQDKHVLLALVSHLLPLNPSLQGLIQLHLPKHRSNRAGHSSCL